MSDSQLTVLSLGAGVQSSTMALMAKHGDITPMPDCAIFADTQAEPQHVYDWLDWLEEQLTFPVYRVSNGNLRDEGIEAARSGSRYDNPPLFTLMNGEGGILFRTCTSKYKIWPIEQKIRELIGLKPRQRAPTTAVVEQWIGISWDEIQRMKANPHAYITNRFPLIEREMTRLHCLEWLRDHGYNELPAKSACTFCPYHDNKTWRQMKENDRVSWIDAVNFDHAIRDGFGSTKADALFVHSSRTPLASADLSDPSEGQAAFSFMDECEGMCGV